MINLDYLADTVMSKLLENGTEYETGFIKKGFIDDHNYRYKSTYRFISYLVAPTMGIREQLLNNKLVTLEETKEIMAKAHPYFLKLLETKEGRDVVESNYQFIVEAWE